LKINQFIVTPYSIPFTNSLQTSGHTFTHRDGLWLCIKGEENSGWGEAAPLAGFSKETLQDVHYALEGFHQAIDGEVIDIEELPFLIEAHTEGNPSTRFALETAFYDLLSKNSNQSISEYLNPNACKEVAVNGIAGIHTPKEGFLVIKVKVGFRNLFDEIEYMELLRSTYGDNVLFRLDANGAFDLPKAIRFCKEMEVFNIDYIEQPLPSEELVDLAELRYHTNIPIAIDESLTDCHSAEENIKQQTADIFVIKPMISGGFVETRKIVKLAKQENIRVVITSSLETEIGRMACLHVAAANEISESCGLATGTFLQEDKKTENINEGKIVLPQSYGLGIAIEE
tara:strand:- start:16491 stop:17516 length:1026 start_codon:yes stop_codon:yes gene_type:complete